MEIIKTPQRQSDNSTDYSASGSESVSISVSESLSPNVYYTREFYSHNQDNRPNDRSLSPIRQQRYNSGEGEAAATTSRSISPLLVPPRRIENRMFDSVRRILDFSLSPILPRQLLHSDSLDLGLHISSDTIMGANATFSASLTSPNMGNVECDESTCSVCYDILPQTANRVYTVCGHLFCVKCILNWNDQQNTCPLCRRALIEIGDDDADADDDDGESIYDGIPNADRIPDPIDFEDDNGIEIIDNNFHDNLDNNRIITYINEFRYSGNIFNNQVNQVNEVNEVNRANSNGDLQPENMPEYSFEHDGFEEQQITQPPIIDQYLYDDDGFLWRGVAEEDDEIIPLPSIEIYHLNLSRNIARNAIRNYMHQLYLFSTFNFNGRIIHSFIRKSQYLQRPLHTIGRGHFYEFVLKTTDTRTEENIFGFISNITLVEVKNTNRDFLHPTWCSTHEYAFTVEFFDPLWVITDNETSAYDEINRCFNLRHFIVKTIRFSEIRRLYHIWGSVSGEV